MLQTNKYINRIKSILPQLVEWINLLSTIYLIASLILSFQYQQLAIYIYFTSLLFDIIINQRYKNVKWHKAKWTFIVMIIFYLCIWIWHIFESCQSNAFFHSTDIRLPFIAFGILGIFFNLNPKIKISHIATTMLIATLTATTYIIYKKYDSFFSPDITINHIRTILPEIRQELLHVTHIEFNLYINCTMALCFICYNECNKKIIKTLFAIGTIFTYIILFINEGRSGFITANILFVLFIIFYIYKNKPKLLIPSIIVFSFIFLLPITTHDRLKFDYLEDDPRLTIWNLSFEMIKEKPLFGYGVCNGKELFIQQITNNPNFDSFWEFWSTLYPKYDKNRFHNHNAFLESAIEFGLIGLIITILIFILPILLTQHKKRLYLTIFILIFSIQAIFESFTYHYQILLFCWIIYFFINIKLLDDNKHHSM